MKKPSVVLYQYSPNGRNDRGEFSAVISNNLLFSSKEEACAFVKAKYEELFAKEKERAGVLDGEWSSNLGEEDMKRFGYSWTPDFSSLSFEFESSLPDVLPEPKFSWTVVELSVA